MRPQQIQEQIHQHAVEAMAGTTIVSALSSWFAFATDVLQFAAAAVALGCAVLTYKIYRVKLRGIENEGKENLQSGTGTKDPTDAKAAGRSERG